MTRAELSTAQREYRRPTRAQRGLRALGGGVLLILVCCLFVASVDSASKGGGPLGLSSPGNCPDPTFSAFSDVPFAAWWPTVVYVALVATLARRLRWALLAFVILTAVAAERTVEYCAQCWGNTWGAGEALHELYLPYLGRLALWTLVGAVGVVALHTVTAGTRPASEASDPPRP